MVFLEHRPRVYNALTTVVEATALLFVQQHAKGAIIVNHVTRIMAKMAAISDDCERTATVALTDCQTGVLVDNYRSFAALDGFSTVFEPPLYPSKNGHTHTQKSGHERPHYLAMLRPREVKLRTRTTTLPRCATPTRGKNPDTNDHTTSLCYAHAR